MDRRKGLIEFYTAITLIGLVYNFDFVKYNPLASTMMIAIIRVLSGIHLSKVKYVRTVLMIVPRPSAIRLKFSPK